MEKTVYHHQLTENERSPKNSVLVSTDWLNDASNDVTAFARSEDNIYISVDSTSLSITFGSPFIFAQSRTRAQNELSISPQCLAVNAKLFRSHCNAHRTSWGLTLAQLTFRKDQLGIATDPITQFNTFKSEGITIPNYERVGNPVIFKRQRLLRQIPNRFTTYHPIGTTDFIPDPATNQTTIRINSPEGDNHELMVVEGAIEAPIHLMNWQFRKLLAHTHSLELQITPGTMDKVPIAIIDKPTDPGYLFLISQLKAKNA